MSVKRKALFAVILAAVSMTALLCGCVSGETGSPVSGFYTSLEELSDARIGVYTGTIGDSVLDEVFPDCHKEYMNSFTDLAVALNNGKVDAYIMDEPIARLTTAQYPDQQMLVNLRDDNYGYIFAKNDSKSDKLLAQMNEFLADIKADGTLDVIDSVWFGSDESRQEVDYSGLSAANGIVQLAVATDIGEPFVYIKDDSFVGYDVDIAVRFCREYGYGIKIVDSNFAGMLSAVASGKCDFGGSCISITDERRESFNFSEPNYRGGQVIVVITPAEVEADANTGFWQGVKESFIKTFILEDRWKLFVGGVGTTVLITVLAALFGTLLGFAMFMLYRKDYLVPNAVINVIMNIFEKTPVVVILMIMYYIIFGKLTLDAIWVSVIGFSLIFGAAVISLLKVGVGAVDKGQTEASLALGYTDMQTFFRTVLPQAAKHFLPGYRGELVSLIKGTAIVGYIAVQDLTQVSDIVRSRTYEAFFPLIVSAVIYFVIAWLLTMLVKRIEFGVDPKRRKQERILEGVKTK